jgi:GT2 family glycosyltransferase
VVVLSSDNDATIVDAVRSLLDQGEAAEIVVSHSGTGRAPNILKRRWPQLRIVATAERRLSGATRNAGVVATTAPFVAFLAGDCIARPGWIAGRLRRHIDGAAAVSSVLAPRDLALPSLASHLLQHNNRMVGAKPPPPWFRFGVSYAREMFERYGLFREDLAFAEDAEFNARLIESGVEIMPAPDVVTEHAYPTTVRNLLADQFRRGRMRASVAGEPCWRLELFARALANAAQALAAENRSHSPTRLWERGPLVLLVIAGGLAKAAGVLCAGGETAGARAELEFHRWVRRTSRARGTAADDHS